MENRQYSDAEYIFQNILEYKDSKFLLDMVLEEKQKYIEEDFGLNDETIGEKSLSKDDELVFYPLIVGVDEEKCYWCVENTASYMAIGERFRFKICDSCYEKYINKIEKCCDRCGKKYDLLNNCIIGEELNLCDECYKSVSDYALN